MNKKILVTVVAAALLLCVAVGGTIAYLTATSAEVTNTFSPSTIGLTLAETDSDSDGKPNENTYTMIPGKIISKNPEVTVKANSEKAYVFVKLEKVGSYTVNNETKGFDDYLTYEMAEGWTELTGVTGVTGVYYRTVETNTADQKYAVLKNNQVTVKDTVTSAMMAALVETSADDGTKTNNYPQLKITAYAIQYYMNNQAEEGATDTAGTPFTVADAWEKASAQSSAND